MQSSATDAPSLGSLRIAVLAVQVVAQQLRESPLKKVEDMIRRIGLREGKRSCRYFLDVLKCFKNTFQRKKCRQRLYFVGEAMIEVLSGIPKHEFVESALREQVNSDDYILAAKQLHQFIPTSSWIIWCTPRSTRKP
jgi:hypothetical protein